MPTDSEAPARLSLARKSEIDQLTDEVPPHTQEPPLPYSQNDDLISDKPIYTTIINEQKAPLSTSSSAYPLTLTPGKIYRKNGRTNKKSSPMTISDLKY